MSTPDQGFANRSGDFGHGSTPPFPVDLDMDTPVYVISVVAELTGLHPQTLRTYDRLGLVTPGRTGGGGRRYSMRDIETLRQVMDLTSAGIGLEGVRRILELETQVESLQAEVGQLRSELAEAHSLLERAMDSSPYLPVRKQRPSTAVVVWPGKPNRRR